MPMAPLTIGTAAMIATRTYSSPSGGPPRTNRAPLTSSGISSGLTMPIVEVSTMRPTTTATRPWYGRNSGTTRRAVFRPVRAAGFTSATTMRPPPEQTPRDTNRMVSDAARDRAIYQALKAPDEVAAALQAHLVEEHGADPERAAPPR